MPVSERKLNAHDSDRLVGSEGGVESRVEGVAKVEAVARDKAGVPQGDML